MININSIASQVKHNCNISDAMFWGNYLPCGLLMRMRDLYKVEKGLCPWEAIDKSMIGDWIGKREELWEELESQEFEPLEIDSRRYDPFDVTGINSLINRQGVLYGAGYGNMMKPLFILAEISEMLSINSFTVYIVGKELSRDLSTTPAMLRGTTIVGRKETMRHLFWDKYMEMKAQRCDGLLVNAFSEYGITRDSGNKASPEELNKMISGIVEEELYTYIHHELGEASQRQIMGEWWKELILKVPYSRAELFLRAIKDILSDTCSSGMLAYIIENKKSGSLFFYSALLGGFRKVLFPEIITATGMFKVQRDWSVIESVRERGHKKAIDYVEKLKELVRNGEATREMIEALMPAF